MPPLTVLDALPPAGDLGKQLVDPTAFYTALQMLAGFQAPVATPAAPGPLIRAGVATWTSPPGAGPFNIQLPVALAGLRLVLINLASGPTNLNTSYNPAIGRPDQLTGISPMPVGNVYSCIAYRPGFWYVATVASGLPGTEIIPPDDTPPPEEC